MSTNLLIDAHDIHFYYTHYFWQKPHYILRAANFSLAKKMVYALISNNGSGKSTLLKIIAGFLKPIHGHIHRSCDSAVYVPAVCHLPDFLTVEQILTYTLAWSKKTDDEKIKNFINFFELDGLENQSVGHLSLGMRQRLMLAQGLIQSPDLLLLDEPFSGIDSSFFTVIENSFEKWAEQTTILYVAHRYLAPCTNSVMLLENKQITVNSPSFTQRYRHDPLRKRD